MYRLIFVLLISFSRLCFADWAESSDPLLVRLQPANNAQPKQNPPGLSWTRYLGATGYEISLRGSNDYQRSFRTLSNWYLPEVKLPVGEYYWKVRPFDRKSEWSAERRFVIEKSADIFEVPSDDQLLVTIRARTHPRSLPLQGENINSWIDRTRSQKSSSIQALEKQVRTYAKQDLVTEQAVLFVPRSQDEKAWVDSLTKIRQRTQAESRQIRAASLLWRLTGNGFYRDETIRRGDALASLDSHGSTSHVVQDQGNRAIAWALAVAIDYMASDLPHGNVATWLGAVRVRTNSIHEDLKTGGWRLEQYPFDSHGSTNIGYLAAISAILIDRVPEAEDWFRNSFRFYIHFQSPWGAEEGGFGNGSAYAEYSTWYFVDSWDAIAATTGVNMYDKPWSKGLLRFLACFVPPGSPTNAFGDDAEMKPSATTLKAFANRFTDDIALWYARNLIGTEDVFTDLTNTVTRKNSPTSTSLIDVNACLFKYVGWVAMHSRLADRGRTSIYFKSSPYGSFNHSHGDQNSFTLTRGGRPLLIDSGWYDWYGSPQWAGWYRQTRAHNAITFDGGQGQTVDGYGETMKASGKVTAFSTTSTLDFVEGDATLAYGGALTTAVRRVWYLRNEDAILIWDKVESPKARIFEWNMHAAAPISTNPQGQITVKNQEQLLCITQLLGDDTQFQRRTAIATKLGVVEDHAAFVLREASKSGEFLVLLDIGCKQPKISIDTQSSSRVVVIGNIPINFDNKLKPSVAAKQ